MSSSPLASQKAQRLVLLGEVAVGKSSLAVRFAEGQFQENRESTVGAAYFQRTVRLGGDEVIKFDIWDTAGQERFHSLVPMYYRGAQAAIVVYDITEQCTYDRAKEWVRELKRHGGPDLIIALAGNKADLLDGRVIQFRDVQSYAEEKGLLCMETSAKTAKNVSELFTAIAQKIPRSNLTRHETVAATHEEKRGGCC